MAIACDAGTITPIHGESGAGGDDSGGDDGSGGEEGGDTVVSGPSITIDYEPSNVDFMNPERGFFRTIDLVNGGEARWVRRTGHSLAQAIVRLDGYRDRALDQAMLDAIDRGFDEARAAGIKIVLRFAYNDSFDADASRARMLQHIEQLAPVLTANADVIAVLQAGFIGAWGEWHGSTNGLDNDTDRGIILHALLDAIPPSRVVQVRTPMFKDAIFPGGPLGEDEAWSAEDRARVGHHNDCFLADASDYGTYDSPVATWKEYVATDSRYLPLGGETCALNPPLTDCAAALDNLESLHWAYLNEEYNLDVLGSWTEQGCEGQVRRRLGHRLALVSATHSESVAPGGVLEIDVAIENQGFSALYNPRPVHLVLRRGERRWDLTLEGRDARTLLPGTGSISARVRIPADAEPADDYQLALWFPDAADRLQDDPRYAIQLANPDVWDALTGENTITRALRIDPAAPGDTDPTATALIELPR